MKNTNGMTDRMLKDFNLNRKDSYFLGMILIVSLILTAYYINFNVNLGIYCSDVYIYLLNALYFTGTNINSTNTIYLSPVICFLTSILFDIGIRDKIAIFIVTGIFAVIGNLGLYVLLKSRFDEVLSLCGVIVYSTFAINLTWLANGSLDIPAVSIIILIMLLATAAVNSNPKYYMALIPLFIVGFFTRYTVAFIIPVVILHYLYTKGFKLEKTDLKYILMGILFGMLLAAIILIPVGIMSNGNFGVTGQISSGVSGSKGSSIDPAYNTDVTYYLVNFISFISASKVSLATRTPVLENPTVNSLLILAILAVGLIAFLSKRDFNLKEKALAIIILLIGLLSFNHISSFITILITFLGLLLLGKDSKNKNGLVMLSWVLVHFIFFSYYNIKVNRYIIPAIPPLIYLTLASIELIREKISINRNVIPMILITLFLIQGFTFCFAFEDTSDFRDPEEMSEYIINEIPDYAEEKIGVYNMRPYNWYLGENITGIESGNLTKIENSNVTYYISNCKQENLTGYDEIRNFGKLYLYERKVV